MLIGSAAFGQSGLGLLAEGVAMYFGAVGAAYLGGVAYCPHPRNTRARARNANTPTHRSQLPACTSPRPRDTRARARNANTPTDHAARRPRTRTAQTRSRTRQTQSPLSRATSPALHTPRRTCPETHPKMHRRARPRVSPPLRPSHNRNNPSRLDSKRRVPRPSVRPSVAARRSEGHRSSAESANDKAPRVVVCARRIDSTSATSVVRHPSSPRPRRGKKKEGQIGAGEGSARTRIDTRRRAS